MENLGKLGKDKVTGFKGIITGITTYLYGCAVYGLTPKATDGKLGDTLWFDEGRIMIIGKGIKPESVRVETNGGDNYYGPNNRVR